MLVVKFLCVCVYLCVSSEELKAQYFQITSSFGGSYFSSTDIGATAIQVFKSYGWTLPIILASWLLSTGPKAFLMALAIALGQSALALAFEKLWGRTESKPKRKCRMKRKRRNSWVVENYGSVDSGSRDAPSFTVLVLGLGKGGLTHLVVIF
ncbi:hypothetical protein MTR_4g088590 [Medicago truncatula]|uniref:Transmembrane protein n=1 Tax=Medicago truncatula TaxID=3880 RepID=A0A072UMW3_MEDTR|nr:hypothetical protein MTR_4g088590 [Medicago truncatula]